MAKSYKETLEEILAGSTTMSSNNIAVASTAYPDVMTLEEPMYDGLAYSGDDWTRDEEHNYRWFNDYVDEDYSFVDNKKNISLNENQRNITQETNSQFVPFEMPRFYDGIDLTTFTLSVHFTRSDKQHGTSIPVNVVYNSEKIRFAWLVDGDVTGVAGDVKFEIHATGVILDSNSNAYPYEWIAVSSNSLNVLQSICGLNCGGSININDDWVTELVEKVTDNIYDKVADTNVGMQVSAAEEAATRAESAANSAENAVTNALENYYTKGEIDSSLLKKAEKEHTHTLIEITDYQEPDLSEYATKQFVTDQIEDADILTTAAFNEKLGNLVDEEGNPLTVEQYVNAVDVSDQLVEYVKTEELDKYALKEDIPTNISAFTNDVGYLTEHQSLEGYATEQYVIDTVDAADISGKLNEKLGDLVDVDGNELTVKEYVKQEVDAVDVSEQLEEYAKSADVYAKEETYSKSEVDIAIGNIDLTEYATEEYVGTQITPVNNAIKTINETLEGIDKSPRVTYDATYGDVELEDGSVQEYMFTLWKTEDGTRSPQDRFQILGGGGGTGSSVTMKISYHNDYPQSIVRTVNDKAEIYYSFEGVDSAGDNVGGTASWKVGSKTVLTEEISSGENYVDLTEFVGVGDNKILLTVTHATGAIATKAWTIKIVDVRLESSFDDTKSYVSGSDVEFTYTPYGSIDKTVHFKLNGSEIGTKESKSSAAGLSDSYILSAKEHGSYLLEAYMTATINGKEVESNHIYKDIIWYDGTKGLPVISCSTPEILVMQHDTVDIVFTVYDPSTETPTVSIEDNGEIIDTLSNLQDKTNTYTYVATTVGSHDLVLICGETRKSIKITVEELDINVTPITASLAFDFNPVGYSNSSENRLWSYESEVENDTISMTVSDNFDWINGGYQMDKDGSYFCIKAGTTATINYKMFCASKNIKDQGGHYKLVFKTTNVQDASKPFLQCFKDNVGVVMLPHETNFYAGSGNTLYLTYSEKDTIEFELNMGESIINSADKMVRGYEDGVATKPLVYTSGATFIQGIQDSDAEYITLGSESCDLYIYRFKAFRKAMTSKEIINNYITDARSASEMLKRYNRNQIYNDAVNDLNAPSGYDESYIEYFASKCPDLRVILLSCPRFTKNKSDKVQGCTTRQIYTNGRDVDNWTVYNMIHSGQGTSSNLYGAAGRNLDLIMNKKNDAGEYPWIEFSDGTVLEGKDLELNLTETSVPIAYLNIKLNIASSENANNAELARRYNQFNPYKRPLVREDGYKYDVKDTMEFYNCVVFVQETDTTQDANGNYTQHVEFNDCNWHYYGLGNIGDSKKTDDTRMNDPDDVNEFVIEIMDNNLPNSKFQSGVYDEQGYSVTGSEIAAEWQTYKDDTYEMENKYTVVTNTDKSKYLIDENLPILYELIDGQYILTSDETIDSSKTYYEKNYPNAAYSGLYKDKYFYDIETGETELEEGWGISFECRYEHDDSDHDEHRRIWNEFYEFVIFSSDTEFYNNLSNYCVLDSVMFYYLFTLRYTMIDNRAKNSFWHYGKCADGVYRWDLTMDYDNDSALGIDNFGKQVYRYGYEDFDYVDAGIDAGEDYTDESGKAWVFNAATSTFYNRLRLLFSPELRNLYNTLDGKGAWNAEDLITQFDASQAQFPEEVWRQDIIRKYERPYTVSHINGEPDTTFLKDKSNGRKKYHRREFERNQAIYMASKFRTEDVKGNIIRLRAKDPAGELAVPVNLDLTITPYMYMYVSVDYANGVVTRQYRGKPGIPIVIDYPLDSGDIIAIESASYLQSIGDISSLYTQEATLTPAIRLKEVLLGNSTEGYSNPYISDVTMVKDGLIETINIENLPALDDELDISTLRNLKTLLAKGSGIQGVILARNCSAEKLSLPALSSLFSIKDLSYLKDIDIDSLGNLKGLIIENCDFSTLENFVINDVIYDSVNELTFLNNAPSLNRVRLTGVDWNLETTDILERLYSSSIGGYNANGDETTQAYLSGKVYVQVIKEYDMYKYQERWPDLEIIAGTTIRQVPVYFNNYDGSELEVQYVDEGHTPVDPVTRTDNPIDTPYRESDAQYSYTYTGWDKTFTNVAIGGTYIYTAQFESTIRRYTIKYVQPEEFNISTPLQETSDEYGSYVEYIGDTPVYTVPEDAGAFTFYLFSGWDNTGYVDGDKVITAQYDTCTYTDGYFDTLELNDMRPVELYMLTRLIAKGQISLSTNSDGSAYTGVNGTNIEPFDTFNFSMGYDVDIDGVESEVIIADTREFSGTIGDYYDTGISLFDVDRSFVLALDYEFGSNNSEEAVLMQCFNIGNSDGFKLQYSNGNPKIKWYDASTNCATGTNREMLILRHKAGEFGVHIYISNLASLSSGYINYSNVGIRIPSTDATLIFGCNKSVTDVVEYMNYAKGKIHWAKVWYDDLGDGTCKSLASYIHEKVETNLCGFRRYFLSGSTSSRPVFSFLASKTLYNTKSIDSKGTNIGGWPATDLNEWLNTRFYNGLPSKLKQLIKKVNVKSIASGSDTSSIANYDGYIYIPAIADISSNYSSYYREEITPGSLISYITDSSVDGTSESQDRIRRDHNGNAVEYWLRSPSDFSSNPNTYFYSITAIGNTQSVKASSNKLGVVVMFSI